MTAGLVARRTIRFHDACANADETTSKMANGVTEGELYAHDATVSIGLAIDYNARR